MAFSIDRGIGSPTGWEYDELAQLARAYNAGNSAAGIALAKLPPTLQRTAFMVADEVTIHKSAGPSVKELAKKADHANRRFECVRCRTHLPTAKSPCPSCFPDIALAAVAGSRQQAEALPPPLPAQQPPGQKYRRPRRDESSLPTYHPATPLEQREIWDTRTLVKAAIRKGEFLQLDDPARRATAESTFTYEERVRHQRDLLRKDPIRAYVAREMGLTAEDLAGPAC